MAVPCYDLTLLVLLLCRTQVASFLIEPITGRLQRVQVSAAPPSPRGINIDPTGRYLYAAGNRSQRLVVWAIDGRKALLRRIQDVDLGQEQLGSSSWILPIDLQSARRRCEAGNDS